jgi:hypothetical protein
MYDRFIDATMRYSVVVNYAGTVEIPILLHHPAASSTSASTAASQPPPTLAGSFSAPTAQQQPPYVQRSFVPPAQVLSVDLIFN